MSRRQGSLARDWDKLTAKMARGGPIPTPLPAVLPLDAIRLVPGVFQHRDPNEHEGQSHVRNLVQSIGRSASRTLDPLTVWWDGKAWIGIDGHHRHAAYKAAALGGDHLVPVEVFEGSLGEAMAQAAAGNTKNRRQMSTSEKTQAAWRIVVMDESLSKAQIAEAASVAQGTVANMRRVHKKLCAVADCATFDAPVRDHRELRWLDARRLAEGRDAREVDWVADDEKAAEAMASAILKAIGRQGKKLHVLARALELYDSRLEDALKEHWGVNE